MKDRSDKKTLTQNNKNFTFMQKYFSISNLLRFDSFLRFFSECRYVENMRDHMNNQ